MFWKVFYFLRYFSLSLFLYRVSQKKGIQNFKSENYKFPVFGTPCIPIFLYCQAQFQLAIAIAMEDDQNGRRTKWKITKMEDDQNGRRTKWKMTKIEDDQKLNFKYFLPDQHLFPNNHNLTKLVWAWHSSAPACLFYFISITRLYSSKVSSFYHDQYYAFHI